MSVSTVECRHCGIRTTADLLESHIAERCPRRTPTRPRNDVAALRHSGVPPTVAAMHAVQRHHEPPSPYRAALERGMMQAASAPVSDEDGTPMPWSTALRAREGGR